MCRVFFLGACLVAIATGPGFAEPLREWSNADGSYSFKAKVQQRHQDLIELRREDGVMLRMPLAMLSKSDQMFLQDGGENAFEITGGGFISSPPGYSWKLLKQMEIDLGKVYVYVCSGPSDEGVMTLNVTPQVANGDGVRSSHLKGHWNGLINGVSNMGIKYHQTTKPTITGSIPNRVEYQLSGLNPDNKAVLVRGITVFGKSQTYLFQIIELDNQKSMEFYEISKTLSLK